MSKYLLVANDDPGDFADSTRLSLGTANGSQIEWLSNFFQSWRPSPSGDALLALAMATHAADKLTDRTATSDAWTRDLELIVPTNGALRPEHFAAPLSFLTGDRWHLDGYASQSAIFSAVPDGGLDFDIDQSLKADAVSLFSGGLDSLIGVVDFLERNPNATLALVAHYDGGQASSKQEELWSRIAQVYGAHRVPIRRLWSRPGPSTIEGNLTPVENTTRGRSFLFIAAALAIADSIGPSTPVIVPENGYIALTVPLTRARVGSLSTRTTHPHYLQLLGDAARASGILNPIVNPYEFMTKGEMLSESSNPSLLRELMPSTVSCSHPEVGRWQELPQGNCGYCFPCIIRQASIHAAGFTNDEYSWDVLGDPEFLDVSVKRGADLRAVVNAVFAERADRELLRNGPLPRDRSKYLQTWRRGNSELAAWLRDSSTGPLRTVIDRLNPVAH